MERKKFGTNPTIKTTVNYPLIALREWVVHLRGDMTDNITQLILAAMHDFAEQGK